MTKDLNEDSHDHRTSAPDGSATAAMPPMGASGIRPRRLGIDTHQQPVAFLRRDSDICKAEGFEAHSHLEISIGPRRIIATLNMVTGELLAADEVGLSEAAWQRLAPAADARAQIAHAPTVDSFGFVRAKIYGRRFSEGQLDAIIRDVVARRLSDVEIAAFITTCANASLDEKETLALTRAMINTGNRLTWCNPMVVDKHCVGGLPGNRTTLLVVPIVAALGLTMPKTSSRAITSPAGTADTMETLAPVVLTLPAMQRVVEREGGCIVWGGAVDLSPADDVLIRIERALDLDSEGQLVASMLSKKAAAGSTHVVFDIPVGPTAKVRSAESAQGLARLLERIGGQLGLKVRCLLSDGTQPVGRGVGPALEAHDVLAVLENRDDAPADLRERALTIAAAVVELGGLAAGADAEDVVRRTLESGRALRKFHAICEAQGGLRQPGRAAHTQPIAAHAEGTVQTIDNRLLARAAKLAGAPYDATAGLVVHVRLGDRVSPGQPLFTLHAETRGELLYALDYVTRHPGIVRIEPAP